jgi:iron complex outermembrane receptor protein
VANENLLPEKSESAELLFRYRHSFVEFDVTGFLLWGKNIIDWIKETPDSKSTATNLTKVNTQGVESNLRFRLSSLTSVLGENASLAFGYTRMWQDYDAQNYISESQNKLNYLRDKFTTQFTHRVYKELSASWYFRLQKRMGTYTDYENNVSTGKQVNYPGFSTLDLKLDYKIENLKFNLSMSNLYNTKYVDLGNIDQPGFWLTGGISYVFK